MPSTSGVTPSTQPITLSPIEQLPNELTLLFLQYLSALDLTRMAQVSCHFTPLCNDNNLWKLLFQRDFPRQQSSPEIDWKSHYQNQIQKPARILANLRDGLYGRIDYTSHLKPQNADRVFAFVVAGNSCRNSYLLTGNPIKIWLQNESGSFHETGIQTLEGIAPGMKHLSWNGRLLATGSAEEPIKIWKHDAGGKLRVCQTLEDPSRLPPLWHENQLVIVPSNQTVKVLEFNEALEEFHLRYTFDSRYYRFYEFADITLTSLAWNGRLLALGAGTSARVLEVNTSGSSGEIIGHVHNSHPAGLSWQGNHLFTTHHQRVKIWEVTNKYEKSSPPPWELRHVEHKCLKEYASLQFDNQNEQIRSITWHNDYLFCLSTEGYIIIGKLANNGQFKRIQNIRSPRTEPFSNELSWLSWKEGCLTITSPRPSASQDNVNRISIFNFATTPIDVLKELAHKLADLDHGRLESYELKVCFFKLPSMVQKEVFSELDALFQEKANGYKVEDAKGLWNLWNIGLVTDAEMASAIFAYLAKIDLKRFNNIDKSPNED